MTELTLLERVDAILAQHGIISQPDGDDRTTYISCGPIGCRLRISQDDKMLRLLISFPLYIPDYQRLAMAEALCRINFSLFSGAMEMDMRDGELRFRNALPVLDSVPTQEQLDWLVFWSWGFAKRYAMALLEVAVGACEPEVAVAKVEAVGRQMLLEERRE